MDDQQSLAQKVRAAIDESGSRDPRAIADYLIEQMTDAQARDALTVALPLFVRQILMEHRPTASSFPPVPAAPLPSPAPLPPVPVVPAPSPVFQPPTPGGHRPNVTSIGGPSNGRSRTRGHHGGARYREGWQRALEASVVGADGTRKPLKDCTPGDIDAIAKRIDKQAADAAARARGYREIARVMREDGAATVDALPAETKLHFFGQAAS